ncbi:hypothetical protein [Phenylobacterium montanum]|uniref:Uncharacterized protein n=1 Tax=Phenylobacterium montanum TaxID=2823693 RepID=A0A975IW57_9CAUL|nr:hypothetical protein [Caulobacter sp. S6]QUD88036.1 hypothetical protein KCG34_23895 [Caulobacter sp. S6]
MPKTRRRPRALAATVRVNDQVLTGGQVILLRSAEQDAQSPAFAARARAAAKFHALEAELERRRGELEVIHGLDESLALARARGEQVEFARAADSIARVRVRSRDGLESLASTGAITDVQFRAGMLYRDLYEANDPERDLRSQMSSKAFVEGGSVSVGVGRPEAWAERRLRLSRQVAAVEAKVRVADRNDRAVTALREVAGHARCVSHATAGGGAQARYRRALVLALDVVAEHFGVR